MSGNASISSQEFPLQINVSCIHTLKVWNAQTRQNCCMTCYCHLETVSAVPGFGIHNTHHFTNGPIIPCICAFCNKELTRVQPMENCSVCKDKYISLLLLLRTLRIDIRKIHFVVNVITNKIESIRHIE